MKFAKTSLLVLALAMAGVVFAGCEEQTTAQVQEDSSQTMACPKADSCQKACEKDCQKQCCQAKCESEKACCGTKENCCDAEKTACQTDKACKTADPNCAKACPGDSEKPTCDKK